MTNASFDDYATIRFERQDRVLRIILDSGAPLNGVNDPMHHELARVFTDAARDPDSDLIILTGEGRAFCAGGDMDWFQDMIDDPTGFRAIAPDAKRIVFSLLDCEKPVICRLNGAAAGLGASIALLCDVIIADETALIGDPHVKVGLVAGDGGAVIWPQLIGFARAKEYLMTGDMIPAKDAAAMGLINHAVPGDQLDAMVDEMAAKILGNPRWAVRWSKAAVNITLKEIAAKVMDASIAYEMISNMTRDRQEAVTAFREKRKPNYTGE
jgi:enoyl-CoA hydratase